MHTKEWTRLVLPGDLGTDCLEEKWDVKLHRQESKVRLFWDTFEWGVWFSGHVLYSCNGIYALCSREEGWLGPTASVESAAGVRRFWQDFESEPMRAQLSGLLGLRGVAPVAEASFRSRRCDLRNEEGKVVCRLKWSSVFAGKRGKEELLRFCQVLPLLGYQGEAEQVVKHLARHGATSSGAGPLELLLKHTNRVPQQYTLRPSFGLEMETPAREAVGRIVRAMLAIAVRNVPGILDDLDTEFLHDYRICLRKVRSILGLLKEVYPDEETSRMRTILADLARQTNRLRDLDVYLLARDQYLGLLPPGLRPSLESMFLDFSSERDRALKRVVSALRSPSHRRLLEEVTAYFSGNVTLDPLPAAELPVGPMVFCRVYQRYRKIRAIAAEIGAEAPDEAVHRLRIECKKLRYLMEFFSEIIPQQEGGEMLKMLRRLQNRLGEFNDASVQQESLMEYGLRCKSELGAALGVGGLVAVLYHRQQQARGLVDQELEIFCHGATAANFKHVFRLQQPPARPTTKGPDP